MLPVLPPGTLVLAWSVGRYQIGDVVIVLHGGKEKIKRIVRIDGPRIYIEGDNPTGSTDSRHFGPIEQSAIIAKVQWPRPYKS